MSIRKTGTRHFDKLLKQIREIRDSYENYSDENLRARTGQLRQRLKEKGIFADEDLRRMLDELLPEAYALVCEVIRRISSDQGHEVRLYDEQILGAIALHEGRIVEMKTGEGKTYTATMPLYLNALSGRSCILVTTNEYLAKRDGDDLRPLYEYLGMKEMVGVPSPGTLLTPEQKKEIYLADIVYSTNSALAFDYLYENLQSAPKNRFLRTPYYCIVDEADAVLLDSANNPHIISGASRESSPLPVTANDIVAMMTKETEDHPGDYIVDEQDVWLTCRGAGKVQNAFRIKNLYDAGNEAIVHAVSMALRAHAVMKKDERYIVRDGRIILLDKEGRQLERSQLQFGMHQALEAKEHLALSSQGRAKASITFQNYFTMFPRLAGMTGTGKTDADEFRSIYGLEVVQIPTHRPVQRVDQAARLYPSHAAQMKEAMKDVLSTHQTGQPVLVIVSSIRISDEVHEFLTEKGIVHSVLNANQDAREAAVIKEAAAKGAVTIATSMAGRGTDIKLGFVSGKMPETGRIERARNHVDLLGDRLDQMKKDNKLKEDPDARQEALDGILQSTKVLDEDIWNLEEVNVRDLGGLAVIGIGMMPNRRQEEQARGRSGRQGDVGRSIFYYSLEDDVVVRYGAKWLAKYRSGAEEITNRRVIRAALRARVDAEAGESEGRSLIHSFDVSMKQQRDLVYDARRRMMNRAVSDEEKELADYLEIEKKVIDRYLKDFEPGRGQKLRKEELLRFVMDNITYDPVCLPGDSDAVSLRAARQYLLETAEDAMLRKFHAIEDLAFEHQIGEGQESLLTIYLRSMVLQAIDEAWADQVDCLQQLREIIAGRKTAGRDARREFHMEAHRAYDRMTDEIERTSLRNILLGDMLLQQVETTRGTETRLMPLYP